VNGLLPGLLACPLVLPWPASAAQCFNGTLVGEVTYVRDGDTIELGSMAIRFQGIAAPEWGEPGSAEVTQAIEVLVLGKQVRCEVTGRRTMIGASRSATSMASMSRLSWCATGSPGIAALQRGAPRRGRTPGRRRRLHPKGRQAPRSAAPSSERSPRRGETKAFVRAHRWRRQIESGRAKSITDLTGQEGVTDAYVCRLLPLTCLAPDIVEAILDGQQPKG
jgi:hypothetical protein